MQIKVSEGRASLVAVPQHGKPSPSEKGPASADPLLPSGTALGQPDCTYFAKLSFTGALWYAWRTCALSNAAKPNAYWAPKSENCTSYLLPVTSLRVSA